MTDQFSPNSVPILRGNGVESARNSIQAAFTAARTVTVHTESDSLDLASDIRFLDNLEFDEAPDIELVEIDTDISLTAACVAAAEEASLQAVKLQPQQGAVGDYAWVIEPIVEDPSTIIEEVLRELGEDPQ